MKRSNDFFFHLKILPKTQKQTKTAAIICGIKFKFSQLSEREHG